MTSTGTRPYYQFLGSEEYLGPVDLALVNELSEGRTLRPTGHIGLTLITRANN